MKRTEEYFREIIKGDVEMYANKVIKELATEVLHLFIKKNMFIEADLSDLPSEKQKEYAEFILTARFKYASESVFANDITNMIREEIALFMSGPDFKPKPHKEAKSGKK